MGNGYLNDIPVTLLESGPGVYHMTQALTACLERMQPALIVHIGCGGGFAACGMNVGDLAVAASEIVVDWGIENPRRGRRLSSPAGTESRWWKSVPRATWSATASGKRGNFPWPAVVPRKRPWPFCLTFGLSREKGRLELEPPRLPGLFPLPCVTRHAKEMDPSVISRHIGLYVNEFSRDIGPTGTAAIETITRMARDCGLLDGNGENGDPRLRE